MAYRTIDQKMWDDPKFKALPIRSAHLWIFLLTGPQTSMLPGLQRSSPAILADGLGWKTSEVISALEQLRSVNLIEIDSSAKVIRVPNAPRYNPPANGKVIRGWWKLWRELPESDLKVRHLVSLKGCLPVFQDAEKDWATPAWRATFEMASRTDSESCSEPIPNPVPNPSGTDSPEQDQDHGQEQEQEQSPAPSAPEERRQQPVFDRGRRLTDKNGRTWSNPTIFDVACLWQELHQPRLDIPMVKEREFTIYIDGDPNAKPPSPGLGLKNVLRAIRGAQYVNKYGDYVGLAKRSRDLQFERVLRDWNGLFTACVTALDRHEKGEVPDTGRTGLRAASSVNDAFAGLDPEGTHGR